MAEQTESDNRTKLIVIGVAVVLAIALAIWSGTRAFDSRPRVTGVLGDGPAPRGGAVPTVAPGAPSDAQPPRRGL